MADPAYNPWANVPLAEAMPFGAGATPEGAPTALSGMLSGLMNVPKHLVEAAAKAPQPGLRREDVTDVPGSAQPIDPLVGQSWETARALGQQAPATAVENAAGIFGGKLAVGADLKMLNEAKQAAANGHLNDEIRGGTGWYQHPADRQWRFEIPDSQMVLRHSPAQEGDAIAGMAGDLVNHPPLFKAYPQLAKTPVELTKDTTIFDRGSKDPRAIGSYYHEFEGTPAHITVEGPNSSKIKSTLAHELQHGVQMIEGFSPGGNPSTYSGLILKGLQKNPELSQGLPWANILNEAYPLYRKTSGEVEARNVQTRLNMFDKDRGILHPWQTQDVPYKDQIAVDPATGMVRALRQK